MAPEPASIHAPSCPEPRMTADATPQHLDIVIFGGTGDLAFRKLLPALYMAHLHDRLPERTRIVGIGSQAWGREAYLQFIQDKSVSFIEAEAWSAEHWQRFMARLDYVDLDVTQAAAYGKLQQALTPQAMRVYYLATAPSLFAQICGHLHDSGLIDPHARVVVEKPLGIDLASAQAINTEIARHFREDQIYRSDHYLGKETVQNLMVLRFGNAIFEPLWRAPYIRSVQITVAESVGVGSRDGVGGVRDMVEKHVL